MFNTTLSSAPSSCWFSGISDYGGWSDCRWIRHKWIWWWGNSCYLTPNFSSYQDTEATLRCWYEVPDVSEALHGVGGEGASHSFTDIWRCEPHEDDIETLGEAVTTSAPEYLLHQKVSCLLRDILRHCATLLHMPVTILQQENIRIRKLKKLTIKR